MTSGAGVCALGMCPVREHVHTCGTRGHTSLHAVRASREDTRPPLLSVTLDLGDGSALPLVSTSRGAQASLDVLSQQRAGLWPQAGEESWGEGGGRRAQGARVWRTSV